MVGLSALASFGHAPDINGAARLDFAVAPPNFIWLQLEGRVDLPRTLEDPESGAQAELRRGSLGLAACPGLGGESPAFWFCVGQEVGWTQARGLNLDLTRETSRISVVVFTRVGLSLELADPLWLRVGLTGGVPLMRDRYIFSGPDQETHELFRTQPVVASGELGIVAAFLPNPRALRPSV